MVSHFCGFFYGVDLDLVHNGVKQFLKLQKSYSNFYKFFVKNILGILNIVRAPDCAKGQLISKCPLGFIVWTKKPTKLFLDSYPEFFCRFLGASWKLFGLPGDLECNIINKHYVPKWKFWLGFW